MSKTIELQNGMKAIVDDEDYERVNQYNWIIIQFDETTFRICRKFNKNQQRLSNFILGMNENADSVVVYKNKNPLDNRKSNLMVIDNKKTSHTTRGSRNSSSKYKGVTWCKKSKKWKAQIQTNGKNMYLGSSLSEDEAADLYNKAALKYFGEHAFQNSIGEDNSAITINTPKANKVMRSVKKSTKSKYRGVYPRYGKWKVAIQNKYVGSYNTEEEAARAYNAKAEEIYGDKAILNDLPEETL